MKVKELVKNIDRFYRARMPDTVGAYTIPNEWRRKHSDANDRADEAERRAEAEKARADAAEARADKYEKMLRDLGKL